MTTLSKTLLEFNARCHVLQPKKEVKKVQPVATPKAKEFASFPHIQVGTIFASSWGYEQTNVTFYQVIKRTEKMVELAEIRSEHVPTKEKYSAMAGKVKAKKDDFVEGGKIYKKRLWSYNQDGKNVGVTISSYETAYETTEDQEHYVSWYN